MFVEETVRLPSEPHAPEAGRASAAVIEKRTVGAGVREYAEKTVIPMITIRTLDAAFR